MEKQNLFGITYRLTGVLLAAALSFDVSAAGQLKGTAGVSSIEGGSGGGIIPWATLASYSTRDEYGANLFSSEARVDDYELSVHGFALGFFDRVEVSAAHQDFYSEPLGRPIRQNVYGLKVRVFGDLVYDDMPLISVGLQRKELLDEEVATLVGADDSSGTDYYLSVAKAWIDGPFNRTSFVNVNLRHSEANEGGLLGFGGNDEQSNWLIESAAGLFVTNDIALGLEYRQKRNHLAAFDESSWRDVFVAWFPNKSFSVTAAYIDLGEIAGQKDQAGYYVSLQGAF